MVRLTEIVIDSMSKKTLLPEAELETQLRQVNMKATLRTNGHRNIEKSVKKILADASRAGDRADTRAAAAAKAEAGADTAIVDDDANFVDIGAGGGGGGVDDGGADGVEQQAAIKALDGEAAAEAAEYKDELKKRGVKGQEMESAVAHYNENNDDDGSAELDEEENPNVLDDADASGADGASEDDDAADVDAIVEDVDTDDDNNEEQRAKQPPSRTISKKKPIKNVKMTSTSTVAAAPAPRARSGKKALILTDAAEIAAENAKAMDEHGQTAADVDARIAAEREKKVPMTEEASEDDGENGGNGDDNAGAAKKKRRRTVAAPGAEEDPRDTVKREQKLYYEENLSKVPEDMLRSYLAVVANDYLRGQTAARDNKASLYTVLTDVSLTAEQLDTTQPLLHSTAERLRRDVAMIEALAAVMLDFVRKADAEAYQLIAYSLLGGVKKIVVVAPSKSEEEAKNENSDEPVRCAVLGRPVKMRDTRLLECTGAVGAGAQRREVARQLRVHRELVKVIIGIHTLNNLNEIATKAVADRRNGKLVKKLVKEKADLTSATAEIVNEPVGDSALTTLKKTFKAAMEGVRASAKKFDEARADAERFAVEAEQLAQKKAAAAASHIDGASDEVEDGDDDGDESAPLDAALDAGDDDDALAEDL